ncbi:group 1 glycosyl transferase [Oceaniovalibus guishaninsula JLT2003]|uniref:Group 1 glycosyl transferase n=1 Tax=Oceaniovalibus guishaninsula JLT2003 TaxID=1231392 RepID=K2H8R1_9RHOB|nr:hypothetical protein [Oceaniovalibus guishaninsula]EKE43968.1 group 1 glycosyl transferase [Oceaniovalibus guishaninsula JLT2003]
MADSGNRDAPDIAVILREAGERTVAAARDLAAAQVGADRVHVIREVPFAAALRRGLELGVEAGRRWTLCLDADVLLRPGAVGDLVAAAEAALENDPQLYGVSGTVADKLLGQWRIAGNSLYFTARIPRALEIGSFDAAKRRPESHVKRQMRKDGHRWHPSETVIGLHDDEQSYRDIYRTVFAHSRKHAYLMGYARRYWRRMANEDPDLRVALWSLELARLLDPWIARPGLREMENVAIDVRGFADNIDALLVPAGMAEKPPLTAMAGDEVRRRLDAFRPAPEYEADRAFHRAEVEGGWRRAIARQRDRPAMRPFIRLAWPLLAGGR